VGFFMKRVSFFLLPLLFAFYLFPFASVYGADCSQPEKLFSSVYNIYFQVESDTSATVTQNVSLKNLTGDCFVSEYSLGINSDRIVSASGKDSLGALSVNLNKGQGSTTISTKLNEEVAGLGKTSDFTLVYRIENFATKQGTVWNLTVPKIVASESVENYSLKLLVPKSFGPVFSVSPKPITLSQDPNYQILAYGKELLSQLGVFASFGQTQEITFQSKILLPNKGLFTKKFFVPLPADTEKQKLVLKKLDPSPETISLDEKGNYFAVYSVGFGRNLEVNIEGVVEINGQQGLFSPAKKYSSNQLASFKKESSFVPVESKSVQEKAKSLKTLNEIYSFVTSYLSFEKSSLSMQKAKRYGAESLLVNKRSATTLDFVDLFTAIARAAGYPTREVFGIAVSSNQAITPTFIGDPLNTKNLHVWVQVWDESKKSWLDVDPTWGATSGSDYFEKELPDRFVLLITDSTSGIENLENYTLSSKNLKVGFNQENTTFSPKVDLEIDVDQAVAGLPAEVRIKIKNTLGVALTAAQLTLSSESLELIGEKSKDLGTILPFETRIVKFKLRGGGLTSTSEGKVLAEFRADGLYSEYSKSSEKNVKIESLFSFGVQQMLLLSIFILLGLGIFFQKFKPLKQK